MLRSLFQGLCDGVSGVRQPMTNPWPGPVRSGNNAETTADNSAPVIG